MNVLNLTIIAAKMCIDQGFPQLKGKLDPSLAWCPRMVEDDRLYLLTAIYMIQLSFPEVRMKPTNRINKSG